MGKQRTFVSTLIMWVAGYRTQVLSTGKIGTLSSDVMWKAYVLIMAMWTYMRKEHRKQTMPAAYIKHNDNVINIGKHIPVSNIAAKLKPHPDQHASRLMTSMGNKSSEKT